MLHLLLFALRAKLDRPIFSTKWCQTSIVFAWTLQCLCFAGDFLCPFAVCSCSFVSFSTWERKIQHWFWATCGPNKASNNCNLDHIWSDPSHLISQAGQNWTNILVSSILFLSSRYIYIYHHHPLPFPEVTLAKRPAPKWSPGRRTLAAARCGGRTWTGLDRRTSNWDNQWYWDTSNWPSLAFQMIWVSVLGMCWHRPCLSEPIWRHEIQALAFSPSCWGTRTLPCRSRKMSSRRSPFKSHNPELLLYPMDSAVAVTWLWVRLLGVECWSPRMCAVLDLKLTTWWTYLVFLHVVNWPPFSRFKSFIGEGLFSKCC